jgi:serine phosphatase RsbU (regulator of sigma subunit)
MLTMFATMFVGALNIKTGLVSYINAGHETIFVINSQGKISQNLKTTAPAVGMIPNVSFKIQQAHLEYGDTLFGYTDGVPEAKAPTGEFFQMNKLMSVLEEPFISATALLENISNRLTTHIGEAQQFDDITMIAITRRLE